MTQQTNTSLPPQHGPHATAASTETTFEFELMWPYSTSWVRATALRENGAPFTDASEAWDWWASFAAGSDMYRSAQARLVQIDRRILPSPCEPVDGWESYQRGVAMVEADRARAAAVPASRS